MDWRNVNKFYIGGPYDAEVEYLESNGTQAMVIPNATVTVEMQMAGGVGQTAFSHRVVSTFYKFGSDANGDYSFNGDSFGIPANTRVTAQLGITVISTVRRYGASVTIGDVVKSGNITARNPSRTTSLFASVDANGVATEKASMRLYAVSGYKLVRVGTAGGIYNETSGTLIMPSEGTLACGPDTLVTKEVVKISTSEFPWVPGAKCIEYLQGDSVHNWIDPDITVTDDTEIELKMSFTPASTSTRFGGYTQWSERVGSRIRTASIGCNFAVVNTSPTSISFGTTWTASDTWTIDTPHTLFIRISDTTDQSDPTPKTCLYVDGTKAVSRAVCYNASHLYKFGLCQEWNSYAGVPVNSTEATCRLYGCKIWQGGTLVRDFVPIKVGAEGCLYDKATATVYHNPGTVPFVCGAEVAETVLWRKPVPYDSEVEYLESNGTQWIETGTTVNSSATISVTAQLTSAAANEAVWCARSVNPTANTFTFFKVSSTTGNARYDYGATHTTYPFNWSGWAGKHEYKAVANNLYIDDSLIVTATASTFTAGGSVRIFASNNVSSPYDPNNFATGRLYAAKIVDENGVTIRDFHPVRVGTTGYLFDRISWTLIGNAGTGTFGYGNDVPDSW